MEPDREHEDAADAELEPAEWDPLVGTVDIVVYTLVLGAAMLLMLGTRWVWPCFVALGLAIWGSTPAAEWIVDRLRRWLGRSPRA